MKYNNILEFDTLFFKGNLFHKSTNNSPYFMDGNAGWVLTVNL